MCDLLTGKFMDDLRASAASIPLGAGGGSPSPPPEAAALGTGTILTPDVIQRATWDGCRPLSNDERRAAWARKFYAGGHHHRQSMAA